MKGKSIWLAVVGALILLFPAADARAAEPEAIGMVHFGSAELDGALLASGRIVMDRDLIRTESTQAVLRLDNGRVLKFDANSSARFEAVSFDEIAVTVFSGRVTMWSEKDKPLTAGARSRFTIGRTAQDPMAAERALLRAKPAPGSGDESAARRLER